MDYNPKQLSPLTLAFIGDGVYEIIVREKMIMEYGSMSVGKLHNKAVEYVRASFQSEMYLTIEDSLTEDEMSVMKRGRNANSATVPKNADPAQYRRATGIETLFGYLYLKGEKERLVELFNMATK